MLVGIKGVGREDVGVKDPSKGSPLGVDREPYDGVATVITGLQGIGDMARGERNILLL